MVFIGYLERAGSPAELRYVVAANSIAATQRQRSLWVCGLRAIRSWKIVTDKRPWEPIIMSHRCVTQ